ncbi:methylated-DNA--[protein]-cysteine S-methyltransferase [Oecophyllibacter saccharovorans]|uniref:methylated-DNA--[protein]-cysteine S-methyltransferase n=1 Tax=Oecophyllibacter saccharovorans TaxID=2558360 RepID=UPI001170A191|nr:methylated-DNA--[protein]-cysteine S-methyltransferase [Oecophyllibacter saccharovorans]TPW33796.1 methylated-DNA--[protein]-cysteine S-methyltransferase [Oecophyllibacter saccharovorans]
MAQLSLHTPLGDLTLSEEDGALVSVDEGWGRDQTPTPLLLRARDLLNAYFDGEKVDFSTLPVSPPFGTAYQRKVWEALRRIPHGQTRRYGEIAQEVGGTARSVGQAVAANPVLLLIPCHRVVAAQGMGGYSGFNGVEDKQRLLELEKGL